MIPLRDNIESHRTPLITWILLAANCVAFYFQLTAEAGSPIPVDMGGRGLVLASGFEQAVWRFGLRPIELLGTRSLPPHTGYPEAVTLMTSMFMHGGWAHLLGNMLYLWIFADNVEDAMGHVRFLIFYLAAGLAAAAAQIAIDPASRVPMVGASGAIAGVLGAYIVLYPRAKVLTIIPLFYYVRLVQVPALVLLGFWIVLQLFQASLSSSATGGTAWWAHIGGFVLGAVLVKLFARGAGSTRVKW